ncbi:MAG: lysylphosphatidylglycerol synthase transmembrane domain-containing protein [Flavobacteriales bacterium]|nr:lysylphosphatidylglycerol synthase transmembrane domain-containing protein [Flavobacteriales bacterium]
MKAKLFSALKYLLFLSIGLSILFFVFKDKDLEKMLVDLKNAEYKWLVFSMVFGYAAYLFRALRWLLLLETMNYKTSANHATQAVAAGYFANIIFPRAGELVRCTSLYKVTGIPVNKLFGTILLERAIDVVLLLICICLSFVLKFKELSSFFGTVFNSSSSGEITLGKLIFIVCLIGIPVVLYLFRKTLKKTLLFQKILSLVLGVKEGFQTAFYMKQKGLFTVYTLLIWLMYLLMTYVCFYSIPETMHLTLADGLYITVIGGLGMVVPVQGGIGPYHAAVTLGIVSIGLSETTGATLAVLIHSAQSIMIIITGIIAAIVLSFAKRKAIHNEASSN